MSDNFPTGVDLKPLHACGNASFISRLDRASLARKVTTERKKEGVYSQHRDTFSLSAVRHISLSLSFPLSLPRTFHEICPSRSLGYVSVAVRMYIAVFPPCALRRPEAKSSSTSRGRQVCRRHYSLSSPTYRCPVLPRVLPQRDLSSHYPSPSVYSTSTSTTTTTTTTTCCCCCRFFFVFFFVVFFLSRSSLRVKDRSQGGRSFNRACSTRGLCLRELFLHRAL